MALDKHGVPERNIDRDFFGVGNNPPTSSKDKKDNIDFLLGPKAKQKPKQIKTKGDDGHLAGQLKWGQLVADKEVLESTERTELKKHLDELMVGLNLRYIDSDTGIFPTNEELAKLTNVVFALAKLNDVQKSGFGDLHSAIKRIENRFSKVALTDFANALLNRLCQVPINPVAVLRLAAEKNTNDKATLEAIMKFLNGEMASNKSVPWEAWYQAIWQLKFPTSELMSLGNSNLMQPAESKDRKRLLAYLLLMDLRRQQLEWDMTYGKSIAASLKWIYLLQRPEDFTRLSKVYNGTALSPDKMTKGLETLGNRERRNRSYNKQVGKTGRAVAK